MKAAAPFALDPETLDLVPVPMLAFREDGALLAVNRAAADCLGYARDDLLARSYWELTLPGQKHREISLARQGAVPYDKELLDAAGAARTVRVVGLTPLSTEDVAAYLCAFNVVAEAEAARDVEAELRRHNTILLGLTGSDAVDSGDLARALRILTEAAAAGIGCERASVWIYAGGRDGIRCLDLYERAADRHTAGMQLRAADYPAYLAALAEDRTIVASDAHTHPATREFSASYLTPLGIRSMLDAPIRKGGAVIGVLCHEHVGAPRGFTQEEQSFAAALADLTARALEAAERRRAEETLAKALAAPVLELWQGVLAVPIIGGVDAERSAEITERLLHEVARIGSREVLIDLTGAELDGPLAVEHLLRAARALSLLGARCTFTGLRPAAARALAEQPADVQGLTTRRSLKEALLALLDERARGGGGGAGGG